MADLFGGFGGVIGDLVGGFLNNQAADSRQEDAQNFSAQQYATRYQTTVKDMAAAGLNPMMAYQSIGGSFPTGSPASSAGYGNLGQDFNQGRIASAQVANIQADTDNKAAQADLWEAQAAAARGSAFQSQSEVEKNQAIVKDITNKLENNYYANDVERIQAVAKELQSQYDLNVQRGISESMSQKMMVIQAQKLDAETKLLDNQVDAAKTFDNLGAKAGQLKPALDVLRSILIHR